MIKVYVNAPIDQNEMKSSGELLVILKPENDYSLFELTNYLRTIVRKSHNMKVIITTASDLVIQYLNNMIQLYGASESDLEGMNVDKEDTLNRSEVVIYDSQYHKYECSDYGFVIPEMNEFLEYMQDYTMNCNLIRDRLLESTSSQ